MRAEGVPHEGVQTSTPLAAFPVVRDPLVTARPGASHSALPNNSPAHGDEAERKAPQPRIPRHLILLSRTFPHPTLTKQNDKHHNHAFPGISLCFPEQLPIPHRRSRTKTTPTTLCQASHSAFRTTPRPVCISFCFPEQLSSPHRRSRTKSTTTAHSQASHSAFPNNSRPVCISFCSPEHPPARVHLILLSRTTPHPTPTKQNQKHHNHALPGISFCFSNARCIASPQHPRTHAPTHPQHLRTKKRGPTLFAWAPAQNLGVPRNLHPQSTP
ncbi:hypothetical protein CAURIC_06935 [Corynebacterium auriscanis]|nr:hypothetical protein CAURIC_06935 [Corynebacterium auriscanis]